ncbi:MAG: DUF2085 domain-containing protein [Bacteroidetes bacterium]|nr:DUF2085 domain-containing protein [Bacteroidota bacterium]MBU1115397.1 DUF2085 domain-containing protein [Bacteroidota bacterium]MBU1797918.1 DUF2085 domain-containing protein [Bacteroidota bacterium]
MSLKVKFIISFAILFWIFGIFIEFVIPYFNQLSFAYPFLSRIYSTVCHQQVEKLIVFDNHSTLVCSRCSGIYLGGLISSFILLFVSKLNLRSGIFMILASFPMLINVFLYSIGTYNYSKIFAFITGVIFGLVGIVYIYNGFQILIEKNE